MRIEKPYNQYVGKWFERKKKEKSYFLVISFFGTKIGPGFNVIDFRIDKSKAILLMTYYFKNENLYTPTENDLSRLKENYHHIIREAFLDKSEWYE